MTTAEIALKSLMAQSREFERMKSLRTFETCFLLLLSTALILTHATAFSGKSTLRDSTFGFQRAKPSSNNPAAIRGRWVQLSTEHFDADSLAKRLRATKAVGFFTKLQLKGDIESLVQELRDHHNGKGSATLMELDERFQLLFHKIVSLVQDKDPQLAKDITNARQSLWEWVSDPNRSVKL